MKRIFHACAGALLALAGLAGVATAADAPLLIHQDQLPDYWTPVEPTITRRLPEAPFARRGKPRPMSSKVTLTAVIDADGEVRKVKVIDAVPARSDASWAVLAMKAFTYEPAPGNAGRTPVQWTQDISLLPGPPVAPEPGATASPR